MPTLLPVTFAPFTAPEQPVLEAPAAGARLRPWRPQDAPAVRAVYADESIQRWHVRVLESDDEAREVIAGWRDGWAEDREASWAVVDAADDGVLLGRMAVKTFDPHGVGAVAYWTAPAARGRGVAPAALDAAAVWAFGAGFRRLELVHSTANAPSCRVAEKAAFPAEGVLRQSVKHLDGWHDMHLHGRVADPVAG